MIYVKCLPTIPQLREVEEKEKGGGEDEGGETRGDKEGVKGGEGSGSEGGTAEGGGGGGGDAARHVLTAAVAAMERLIQKMEI